MKIIREEFEGDDVYTLGKESDDTISFTVVQDNCHLCIYFDITHYNNQFLTGFTVESLIESIYKVEPEFFIDFIELTVDSYLYRKGCQKHEAYIFAHQLFAKGFRFIDNKEDEEGSGHVLGCYGDNFSIAFRDGITLKTKEFCFHKRFYKQFFSTKISEFTIEILESIPSEEIYYKFYDYIVRGMITEDTPAIKRALLPFQSGIAPKS